MKSVADMEAKGGADFMLRIGNHQVKKVRLHVIVAFFIGDCKSADMLCGRFVVIPVLDALLAGHVFSWVFKHIKIMCLFTEAENGRNLPEIFLN
jgi:hypothetical protein